MVPLVMLDTVEAILSIEEGWPLISSSCGRRTGHVLLEMFALLIVPVKLIYVDTAIVSVG